MRRSIMPPPAIRARQNPLRALRGPVDTGSIVRMNRRPSRRSWEFTIVSRRVEEPDASVDQVLQALMKELEKE